MCKYLEFYVWRDAKRMTAKIYEGARWISCPRIKMVRKGSLAVISCSWVGFSMRFDGKLEMKHETSSLNS